MHRLAAILCTALMLATTPAWAEVGRDGAAAAAQRATGGRVLSVERAGAAWRVKVVTASGEVRVVMVNAATGRPM
ncbi:MAG: peptidase [Comamonadaceae bacterium]|nr:MAG: peptidase [Comamonadaceae bacterium]